MLCLKAVVLLWLAGFILGGLGAWVVSRSAGRFGLIDSPNERSSHSRPTPRGGGVGIIAAFLLASGIAGISPWFWLPMGAMAALAFLGDWVELSPKVRLPVQLLLAGVVVAGFWKGGGVGVGGCSVVFVLGVIHCRDSQLL